MSTHMLIEMIGYISSILVLVSFLMSSVVKLRVINSIGAFTFAIYAMIIQSYPTAIMNFCLVAINIYYLVGLKKDVRHFEMVEEKRDSSFLKYILEYYKDDINIYFPNWNAVMDKVDKIYVICCDSAPAGILLGEMRDEETMEIVLDYSTPTYRDCSVGKYVYARLPQCGIRKLTFPGKAQKHEAYLQKMGFVKVNDTYEKELE